MADWRLFLQHVLPRLVARYHVFQYADHLLPEVFRFQDGELPAMPQQLLHEVAGGSHPDGEVRVSAIIPILDFRLAFMGRHLRDVVVFGIKRPDDNLSHGDFLLSHDAEATLEEAVRCQSVLDGGRQLPLFASDVHRLYAVEGQRAWREHLLAVTLRLVPKVADDIPTLVE